MVQISAFAAVTFARHDKRQHARMRHCAVRSVTTVLLTKLKIFCCVGRDEKTTGLAGVH